MENTFYLYSASIILAFTYLALALADIASFKIDRTWAALIGAALAIITGCVSPIEVIRAIDLHTLFLLFGMMVIVGSLRLSGGFHALNTWAARRIQTPHQFLFETIFLSGFLSAFLVNDVVCLALTPVIIHLSRKLKMNPLPQLIGLATAANIGSVATLVGNPQNMIIGSLSQISYARFAAKLAPVALLGLLVCYGIVAFVFRKVLNQPRETHSHTFPIETVANSYLMKKSILVSALVVIFFFLGFSQAIVAMIGAAILLTGPSRPKAVWRQIDWKLLLLFIGLFIVIRGFELQVATHLGIEKWNLLIKHPVAGISVASLVLSNLVSNVPAVLLFKPLIPAIPTGLRELAWLALAMSSTLAGNLTILGSVANLIVVENAKREGVKISFLDYFRGGFFVTLATLLLGVAWLAVVRY